MRAAADVDCKLCLSLLLLLLRSSAMSSSDSEAEKGMGPSERRRLRGRRESGEWKAEAAVDGTRGQLQLSDEDQLMCSAVEQPRRADEQ